MATADGKLNVSELDFTKIKENLLAFMSNQDEFVGYNFQGSSFDVLLDICLLYTSPSPRDVEESRMPSSA